jgi:ATP/maltotriose-dependent transcriptional regulator MalT
MLLTKIHIPSPAGNIVHRSKLFEKLNEGLDRKLILISAPAGFGKTTLISDWINQNKIPAAKSNRIPNKFVEDNYYKLATF